MEAAFSCASRWLRPGWCVASRSGQSHWIVAAIIFFYPVLPLEARLPTEIRIEPGPTTMSEEEKAIVADPERGLEHGIVLVEETIRDDSSSTLYARLSYHMRAKILSNEARDLADVVIPYESTAGYLKKWWGRTLLPDGTFLELKESELSKQVVAEFAGREFTVLKAALPGVRPGCVIDFGYSIIKSDWPTVIRVPLQRSWPMKQFRYQWVPWLGRFPRYYISRGKLLDLDVVKDRKGFLVTARDVPPKDDEPWSPPDDQVAAVITFYYSAPAAGPEDYWNGWSKEESYDIKEFNRHDRHLRKALEAMELPPDADLHSKLRSVYDWMADNVTNTSLRSWEERQEKEADGDAWKKSDTAKQVLADRAGSSRQHDYLFIGFARKLGAEAHEVMVVNRTEHFWDPFLLSARQFDSRIVAVRLPDEPLERSALVDPGSGLPYGEVPWWYAATKGMVVQENRGLRTIVWPSEARANVSDSRVEIRFQEEGMPLKVRWWRTGKGQHGLLERRRLRYTEPSKREERLERMCGDSSRLEISRVEMDGLEQAFGAFEVECEGELMEDTFLEGMDEYYLPIAGPWFESYPEFTSDERTHPVVMRFRCVDMAMLDVRSPPGFEPSRVPEPVRLGSQYGKYSLSVRPGPEGYHVERLLALLRVAVPVEDYAGLKSFLDEVRRADATQLLFVRAEDGP